MSLMMENTLLPPSYTALSAGSQANLQRLPLHCLKEFWPKNQYQENKSNVNLPPEKPMLSLTTLSTTRYYKWLKDLHT